MTKGWALITGASEGIGREFAFLFASDGYSLILVARNSARLQELAKELSCRFGTKTKILPKDLTLPGAVPELKAEVDQEGIDVEILVNNAGFGLHGFFLEIPWERTEAMLELNMMALTHLTRLFVPQMMQARRGKILNVSSTAAFQPGPLMACYFASKAYVLSFTEALSNELSGTGVTVTTLCPGPTLTQFQKRSDSENIRENTFSMGAARAAKAGYRGLMKGKTLVVPGFFNKLLALLVRLSPRKLVLRVTRFLEEPK